MDVTLTIDEGDPVIVQLIDYKGFDAIPEGHLRTVKGDAPIKVKQPRDKALVLTTREMALNELRDHGYPYASVTVEEDDGQDGNHATLTFVGDAGKLAYFGPTTVQGNESVSDRVIRRTLRSRKATSTAAAASGRATPPLRPLALPVRQRRAHRHRKAAVIVRRITVAEGPTSA